MKRVVSFPAECAMNQKRFELLYTAMLVGGNQPGPRGGIEVLRREARILDALDGVSLSDEAATKINGEPGRTVIPDTSLTLDQPDFELLKKRMEETPWLTPAARAVVDAVDWLSAAPEPKEVTA